MLAHDILALVVVTVPTLIAGVSIVHVDALTLLHHGPAPTAVLALALK